MHTFRPLLFLFIAAGAAACSASKNPQRRIVKALVSGKIKDDTSFVYHLPYNFGDKHLLVQGYFTRFTHKESAALDFKMKRGTTVTAARGGVVVRAKSDGDRGGWKKKYKPYANIVVIAHADGTKAGYWHLQQNSLLVQVGDTVKQDQPIARSGRTGYAFGPHLHFIVWRNPTPQTRITIPTRFRTKHGDKYLRQFHAYRKIEPPAFAEPN